MKVLHIVGNPSGKYGPEDDLHLVRIWQDEQHHPHVEATAPEFETFAEEIQRRIDSRLYSGKNTPIYKMVGWTRKDGVHVEAVRTVQPEDEDFLDTLKSDPIVFDSRGVAGHKVWDSASYITEE